MQGDRYVFMFLLIIFYRKFPHTFSTVNEKNRKEIHKKKIEAQAKQFRGEKEKYIQIYTFRFRF